MKECLFETKTELYQKKLFQILAIVVGYTNFHIVGQCNRAVYLVLGNHTDGIHIDKRGPVGSNKIGRKQFHELFQGYPQQGSSLGRVYMHVILIGLYPINIMAFEKVSFVSFRDYNNVVVCGHEV